MNIASLLTSWKWIAGGIFIFGVLIWAYGEKRYEAGQTNVYQNIIASPVHSDTVFIIKTVPPITVIKWLRADAVYETPDSIASVIKNLSNNYDSLKWLLAEKAKPYQTEIDSARYYLQVLSHPWERMNEIKLTLKPYDFNVPVVTNTKTIVKDVPLYQHILEIGGGALVGYGVSRIK